MRAMVAQPEHTPTGLASTSQTLRAVGSVAVVLPSSPPHRAGHLHDGLDVLRKLGVDARPPVDRADHALPHLAGNDALRARELAAALSAADVDAVWCGRGGSGALRTLHVLAGAQSWANQTAGSSTPRLVALDDAAASFAAIDPSRRDIPLVGLSDATALLLARAFGDVAGVAIHGPVVTQLPKLDAGSADALATWLRAPDRLPVLIAEDDETAGVGMVGGQAEGRLVAGNLSMLASCAGTPESIDTDGAILVIEEVAEPAYRIDRMIAQLKRAGCLDGLAGLAWGTFTDCPRPDLVADCLADWSTMLGVPTAGSFPIGHGVRCRPVALGLRYRLRADDGVLEPLQTVSQWLADTSPQRR